VKRTSIATVVIALLATSVQPSLALPAPVGNSSHFAVTARVPSPPIMSTPNTSKSRTLVVAYALGASNGSPITSVDYSID
jgi:hypothetical protein